MVNVLACAAEYYDQAVQILDNAPKVTDDGGPMEANR